MNAFGSYAGVTEEVPLERRERTPSEARASRFRSAPPTPDTPLKTPSVVFVPISGASHGAGRSFGPNHPSDAGAEDDADAPDAARSSGRAREAASARRTFERSDLTSSSSSQSKAGGPEPEDVDAARDAHTRCSARATRVAAATSDPRRATSAGRHADVATRRRMVTRGRAPRSAGDEGNQKLHAGAPKASTEIAGSRSVQVGTRGGRNHARRDVVVSPARVTSERAATDPHVRPRLAAGSSASPSRPRFRDARDARRVRRAPDDERAIALDDAIDNNDVAIVRRPRL